VPGPDDPCGSLPPWWPLEPTLVVLLPVVEFRSDYAIEPEVFLPDAMAISSW
jgi:hypothetical protein